MKRVLVLCTGNSCRSQMAEGFFREVGGDAWRADSAGTRPAGSVHPMAIQVMEEIGVPLSNPRSKNLDEFVDHEIDLVITVCSHAKENCPVMPGAKLTLHWPFVDPAEATGSEEDRLAVFRKVRDEIRQKVSAYLTSPDYS